MAQDTQFEQEPDDELAQFLLDKQGRPVPPKVLKFQELREPGEEKSFLSRLFKRR